ncbi:MAG: hypothetical protein V1902_00100 [Candidatus Falkowbacteria bacterium]
MGSLLKELPSSELVATIEEFGRLGVTHADLKIFRSLCEEEKKSIIATFRSFGSLPNLQGFVLEPYKRTTAQVKLREIMGKNMFGIEDALMHFDAWATSGQIAALDEIPYSKNVLRECKETHVLIADFGLSIRDMWKMHRRLFRYRDKMPDAPSEFLEKRAAPQWRLIAKYAKIDICNAEDGDTLATLGNDEEMPIARELVYAAIGMRLARGEILFHDVRIRTDEGRRFEGWYMHIGPHDEEYGLGIFYGGLMHGSVGSGIVGRRKLC